ncbi:hypothetical protein LPE509_02855 [Legionella pneumophila subsp. pneumophila LPE509]|nr:hypothetical protein LPE509_02855 [Legionella pneumophila subsp. pneumophila LPE509]
MAIKQSSCSFVFEKPVLQVISGKGRKYFLLKRCSVTLFRLI